MQLKQTKIVATVSDKRCEVDFIKQLFDAGMNVVRLNTAHLDREGIEKLTNNIRAVSNRIAILMDTKGPEVRTTQLAEPIAFKAGDRELFAAASRRFLDLILLQDKLLATRTEFRVGRWIESARKLGHTPDEKDRYEWNARVQITTWGNRVTADDGGLRDYAHKEWNGLLRDFYYMRWKTYFDELTRQLDGGEPRTIDFYALEEPWTLQHNAYASDAEGDALSVAREVYEAIAR